jgi:hypothetical protein
MQSVTSQRSPSSSGRSVVPAFRVVIVYEDFITAKRAKQAYEFLVANLTREWRVVCQMWKFELLRLPALRRLAAEDAALADVIIVSCRAEGELPADLRAWVKMWLDYKGDNVALIALLDCPPGQAEHAQATQAYLERIAQRAHMEFFSWPQSLPKQRTLIYGRASATMGELVRQAA